MINCYQEVGVLSGVNYILIPQPLHLNRGKTEREEQEEEVKDKESGGMLEKLEKERKDK